MFEQAKHLLEQLYRMHSAVFVQLCGWSSPQTGDEAEVPLWESIVYYPVGAI